MHSTLRTEAVTAEKLPPVIKQGSDAGNPPTNAPHVKNPRRVEAGRRNRAKRGPLSIEAREKLRQAALKTRPWEKSTGPKTPEGKAISGRNWRRGNGFLAILQQLQAVERSILRPAVQLRRSVKDFLAQPY